MANKDFSLPIHLQQIFWIQGLLTFHFVCLWVVCSHLFTRYQRKTCTNMEMCIETQHGHVSCSVSVNTRWSCSLYPL